MLIKILETIMVIDAAILILSVALVFIVEDPKEWLFATAAISFVMFIILLIVLGISAIW